jgi:virginiamycin A acetyltransferase
MPLPAPDPTVLHPIAGQRRVVFLRPLVQSANVEVGEYTYYDCENGDPLAFERDAVLYAFGPERLTVGRFCAIASGVRFLMPGANHADLGPSTFPFGVFGPPWETTMEIVMSAPSRGDTVVGHDVWLGYSALVLPGVTIGHGAVVAAGSVVARDVPPYAVVAGNPARVVRSRFSEEDVERLLCAAWWNWPIELVTDHARTIMSGTAAELDRIATEHGLRGR